MVKILLLSKLIKISKINFNEITVMEIMLKFKQQKIKKYIYYKSLKDLIENLPNEFMRVHNSHIVNLTNIDI
jgi:DNA-binding LytR/AlgR family response regulator